jgi:hypothetical protein
MSGRQLAPAPAPAAVVRLRRLARARTVVEAGARAGAGCDLCGGPIDDDHRHLLSLQERRILCTCEPCFALRSGDPGLRPSGSRAHVLSGFELDDEAWARFQIPIGLAFFFLSEVTGGVVALYPSPAGATESELSLEAWNELVQANPVLAGLEREVEALIVDRSGDEHRYAIVPIDRCYELVGAIKSTWTGISGGSAVEDAVAAFFARLSASEGPA